MHLLWEKRKKLEPQSCPLPLVGKGCSLAPSSDTCPWESRLPQQAPSISAFTCISSDKSVLWDPDAGPCLHSIPMCSITVANADWHKGTVQERLSSYWLLLCACIVVQDQELYRKNTIKIIYNQSSRSMEKHIGLSHSFENKGVLVCFINKVHTLKTWSQLTVRLLFPDRHCRSSGSSIGGGE